MRDFRLILCGGVTGMVLGGLRALVHGEVPVGVAARWAAVGSIAVLALLGIHAVLARSVEGTRHLALTLLVGAYIAVVGGAASALAAAGRDAVISAAVLAVLAIVLAPLSWAWASAVEGWLGWAARIRSQAQAALDQRGRNASILTIVAAVALMGVIARGLLAS